MYLKKKKKKKKKMILFKLFEKFKNVFAIETQSYDYVI
jgi:hypothetical protein